MDMLTLVISAAPRWHGMDVLTATQFTREHLEDIFQVSSVMKTTIENGETVPDLLRGCVLGNVFYEPSTRTRASFEAAAYRLGANVINISASESSVTKGETLQDTMRCIECYTDVLVLRHPKVGAAQEVWPYLRKPLISAGDGSGEHPTQALLDYFTIMSELGRIDGLTIAILGDLKHGRTVHSLCRLLCKFKDITLILISPHGLELPENVYLDIVRHCKVVRAAVSALNKVVRTADVLYVTRLQQERFATEEEYDKVRGSYVIDSSLMKEAQKSMIVMHPLPRRGEIKETVDSDPRCVYFKQMTNGMYVRMALLSLIAGRAEH